MYGSEAGRGQCKISERSFPGKALKGHTFKEFAVRAIVECQNTCERDPRCASYNFYIPGKVCELNSQTKEERPEDFVTDELRFYMRREGTIICLFSPVYFLVLLMELRTCECQNTIAKNNPHSSYAKISFVPLDDDECLKTPPVCDVNANCKNTLGSYLCSCIEGFTGDGKTYLDECQMSTYNCSDNATCINTEGSFNCSCKPGYRGNGYNCSDEDECQISSHNCSDNATCINTKGSFNCSCKPGYRGNGYNCSGTCLRSLSYFFFNVDECQISSHNCSDNATCINTEGSFNCSCKPGYRGNGYNCSDLDECQMNSHNCSDNASCINTQSSFYCSCKPGYRGNGYNCTDNDECLKTPPVCDVNANCKSTLGSYLCSCIEGFTGDGKTCQGKILKKIVLQFFAYLGHSQIHVDDCQMSTHNCSDNATCINTEGSSNCSCKPGYRGNGYNCSGTCLQS
ncbi:unnamed protein product, partial [Porites lobata]